MSEAMTGVEDDKKIAIDETLAETSQEQAEIQPLIDFELLRDALGQQVETMQRQFKTKHRHLLQWARHNGYSLQFLGANTGRALMAGGLMVSLLTSAPQTMAGIPRQTETVQQQQQDAQLAEASAKAAQTRAKYLETVQAAAIKQIQAQQQLMIHIRDLTNQHQLSSDPALVDQASTALTDLTGISTTSSLEGYQLNTNVGRIGAEQHLKRYPGDSISGHNFTASGMAPGLGAYGYFASSRATLTAEAAAREEYYVAVQTFDSPQWKNNVKATYNWFKYRKVLVYSPITGQAVVADVADAGPGQGTGKAFGGSPEVMSALNVHDGSGSPPVVMLFVDDPNNQIPLGPVQFKNSPFEVIADGGIQ